MSDVQALVHWLKAKWQRHGELEDLQSAAALEQLQAENARLQAISNRTARFLQGCTNHGCQVQQPYRVGGMGTNAICKCVPEFIRDVKHMLAALSNGATDDDPQEEGK